MNWRILLLKTEKLSDFLRWGSKLFLSIMVSWKTVFEKVEETVVTVEVTVELKCEGGSSGDNVLWTLYHFHSYTADLTYLGSTQESVSWNKMNEMKWDIFFS